MVDNGYYCRGSFEKNVDDRWKWRLLKHCEGLSKLVVGHVLVVAPATLVSVDTGDAEEGPRQIVCGLKYHCWSQGSYCCHSWCTHIAANN